VKFVYVINTVHGHTVQAKISRTEAIMVAVRANGLELDSEPGKQMTKDAVKAFSEQMRFHQLQNSVQVGLYEIQYFAQ